MNGIRQQGVWVKDAHSDDNPDILILRGSHKAVVLSRNPWAESCKGCWFLRKGSCTNAITVCTGIYTEDPSAVLEDL